MSFCDSVNEQLNLVSQSTSFLQNEFEGLSAHINRTFIVNRIITVDT